jgi:hypothetical protein
MIPFYAGQAVREAEQLRVSLAKVRRELEGMEADPCHSLVSIKLQLDGIGRDLAAAEASLRGAQRACDRIALRPPSVPRRVAGRPFIGTGPQNLTGVGLTDGLMPRGSASVPRRPGSPARGWGRPRHA